MIRLARNVALRIVLTAVLVAALLVIVAQRANALPPDACWVGRTTPHAWATSIDDSRTVGGWGNRERAVVWNADTDNARWLGGIEGGLSSVVLGISPNGQHLVGQAGVASSITSEGWRWNAWKMAANGRTYLQPKQTVMGWASRATAVNDAGLILGADVSPFHGETRPWVWMLDGTTRYLVSAQTMGVVAISASGDVAAYRWPTAYPEAWLWNPTTRQRVVGPEMLPVGFVGPTTMMGTLYDQIITWDWATGTTTVLANPEPPAPVRGDHPVEVYVASETGHFAGGWGGTRQAWVYAPGEGYWYIDPADGGGRPVAINRHGELLMQTFAPGVSGTIYRVFVPCRRLPSS